MNYKRFVYLFNKDGKYLKTFLDVKEASIGMHTSEDTIYTSINQQRCVMSAFYFSYDRNFKKPEYKREYFTPIFAQHEIFGDRPKGKGGTSWGRRIIKYDYVFPKAK